MNPQRVLQQYRFKIHFKIIFQSMLMSFKWSPFLAFPHQYPVAISLLLHTCYISIPSNALGHMHKCFNNAHLSGYFLSPRSPMMRSGFALCRVVTEWTGLVWTVLQYAFLQLVVISCVGTGLSNGRSPILDDQRNVKSTHCYRINSESKAVSGPNS
jgi:hypothetical protein